MESNQDIRCLRCGGTLAREGEYCSICGLDLKGPDAAELRDLEATERQIQRFLNINLLENTLIQQLQSTIKDRRTMLGVRIPSLPKTAIEPKPAVAVYKESPVIPDPSAMVAPKQPEPLAPAPAPPCPDRGGDRPLRGGSRPTPRGPRAARRRQGPVSGRGRTRPRSPPVRTAARPRRRP